MRKLIASFVLVLSLGGAVMPAFADGAKCASCDYVDKNGHRWTGCCH